jgi:hypothetical protein
MNDESDYDEPDVAIVSHRYHDEVTRSYIRVISDVEALTAAQARALARLLIAMADRLDELEGGQS